MMTTTFSSAREINTSYYLHHKKPLWNLAAVSYAVGGYCGAITLLISPSIWLNILGVVLLTHSLVVSAYLSHEFMHGTIFAEMKWNVVAGNIMLWLNGGCYGRFKELAQQHIAHHVNRVDFSAFNLPAFIQSLPTVVRNLILWLEWLYFPVISLLLQWRAILAPFSNPQRQDRRIRTISILVVRGLFFTGLALISLKALVLYFLAYIGMITVLRFIDAFQHTYEAFPVGATLPKRDRTYEQANTFSNLFSQRYWWLNLLLLNFGYHNAHHELMKCPWHNLRELDNQLFTGTEAHYVNLSELLANYHRFRVARIFSGQGKAVDQQGNPDLDTFYGAVGVSFLVEF